MGVGFAAVSTTLLMNGNVNVSTNNDDFDVIFTKAVLDGIDISSTAITDGGKTITFETKDLVAVGDISKLDFEITNYSTMYDADVSIEYTINEENKEYYEITKEVETPIAGKTKGKGKVEVKLLKAPVNNVQGTFKCTLKARAKERAGIANNILINEEDFDVRFTRAKLDRQFDVTSTAISEDGKTFTFNAGSSRYGILSDIGDKSTFDFEVMNNSEMYDADVSIECDSVGPKSDYYKITKKLGSPILAKTRRVGKVEVILEKASIENINGTITCTLTATAKERSTEVVPSVRYTPKYFEYGNPTTSSLQYFDDLEKNVFAGLDADGIQKSVCIIRNGNLFCIKNNNYADSVELLHEEFGVLNCGSDSSYSSGIMCSDDNFKCAAYTDGGVQCFDNVSNDKVYLFDSNEVSLH